METQKEITLLRELGQEGSSFAKFFGGDLDRMVENLENGLPIEFGTSFKAKVTGAKTEAVRYRSENAKTRKEILKEYFICHGDGISARFEAFLFQKFGRLEVLKAKHLSGQRLSGDDFEWLLQSIEQKIIGD